ncbi:MAG: PP2C family protein-serine/threonine phosphatase [Thermoplasmatota archaeon]
MSQADSDLLCIRHQADWGPWAVGVRSDRGAKRPRQEDAWALAPLGKPEEGQIVAAAFDGLGGLPRGRQAAQSAAEALAPAVEQGTTPGDLLDRLAEAVIATGGATTAVVAWLDGEGQGHIINAGDSAAYLIMDGHPRRANPLDRAGRHMVTDCLGYGDVRGHVTSIEVPVGASLLVCTDGVDGVVSPEALLSALEADDPAAALEPLFDEVHANGSPDNATALLLRRR